MASSFSANENRIGSERVRLRKSQVTLAKELGISSKTLSSWESDNMRCPSEYLVKMADTFGCSVDYLLGFSPERLSKSA